MDRRVTPPKRVTSPTWGPPPPCKQALREQVKIEKGTGLMNISGIILLFNCLIEGQMIRSKFSEYVKKIGTMKLIK